LTVRHQHDDRTDSGSAVALWRGRLHNAGVSLPGDQIVISGLGREQ
jgi:hypothetical protein